MVKASDSLTASFVILAALLVAGFLYALYLTSRRDPAARPRAVVTGIVTVLWVALTALLAGRGGLHFDTVPPTMFGVIILTIVGSVAFARSSLGARMADTIPLAVLVGWQSFRLPLEVLMHRAYEEGLMPVQMSYSGWNFDIITGASAILVAWLIASGRAGRRLTLAWNALGALLLLNVVTIAVLSIPTPLRVFHNEPANIWITQFPFVWLPVVMVSTAIAGHLVIFRKLRKDRQREWNSGVSTDVTVSGANRR